MGASVNSELLVLSEGEGATLHLLYCLNIMIKKE